MIANGRDDAKIIERAKVSGEERVSKKEKVVSSQ
jgi:hypothetical protein